MEGTVTISVEDFEKLRECQFLCEEIEEAYKNYTHGASQERNVAILNAIRNWYDDKN